MVPPIETDSCPVPSEGRGAWPDSWYHPWFAAASRQRPCPLAWREGLAWPGVPGNGGARRRLLARGTRVRGAARRSSRNGSGAVSQQHGSLEHEGAFLPVLVIALVICSARADGRRRALFCRPHADLSSEAVSARVPGATGMHRLSHHLCAPFAPSHGRAGAHADGTPAPGRRPADAGQRPGQRAADRGRSVGMLLRRSRASGDTPFLCQAGDGRRDARSDHPGRWPGSMDDLSHGDDARPGGGDPDCTYAKAVPRPGGTARRIGPDVEGLEEGLQLLTVDIAAAQERDRRPALAGRRLTGQQRR